MPFIKPMLAASMRSKLNLAERWVAEEKFDGHRMIVCVEKNRRVAYSRHGSERLLPDHIATALRSLQPGTYDGELCAPGISKSYGVTELVNSDGLILKLFDILELHGVSTTHLPLWSRRDTLESIVRHAMGTGVEITRQYTIRNVNDIAILAQDVWRSGGEGLILKRLEARYEPGKRPKDAWIKVKQLRSAVLKVIGYEQGLMGHHAKLVLRGDDGVETTVKTKNNYWLAELEKNPEKYVGKNLVIEFQERTEDGSYRHPRWDRWEDE